MDICCSHCICSMLYLLLVQCRKYNFVSVDTEVIVVNDIIYGVCPRNSTLPIDGFAK